MYAIVVNDEKELLKFANEKGFKVYKLEDDCAETTSVTAESHEVNNDKVNKVSINEFLLSLGLKPHIKGFKYLKYIFENGLSCDGGVTKILYPHVASKFNSTPSRVERAIRHAIESALDNYSTTELYIKLFGNFDNKPTNCQFIEGCCLYLENL